MGLLAVSLMIVELARCGSICRLAHVEAVPTQQCWGQGKRSVVNDSGESVVSKSGCGHTAVTPAARVNGAE